MSGKNVKICTLISFHYCTRFNPMQSRSKLTLRLASRGPTRFSTDHIWFTGPAISQTLTTLTYSRCPCNSRDIVRRSWNK